LIEQNINYKYGDYQTHQQSISLDGEKLKNKEGRKKTEQRSEVK
jgi:hypothetical protein